MSEKRRGLGRGLGALIPSGPAAPSVELEPKKEAPRDSDQTTNKSPTRTKASAEGKTASSPKKTGDASTRTKTVKSVTGTTTSADESSKSSSTSAEKSAGNSQSASGRGTKERATALGAAPAAARRAADANSQKASGVSRETSSKSSSRKTVAEDTTRSVNADRSETVKNPPRGRRDMGQALRSTTTVRRPVDMFFLPSEAESNSKGDGAPETDKPLKTGTSTDDVAGTRGTRSSKPASNDDVSRETPESSEMRSVRRSDALDTPESGTQTAGDESGSNVRPAENRAKQSRAAPTPRTTEDNSVAKSGTAIAPTRPKGTDQSAEPSATGDDVSRETSGRAVEDIESADLSVVPGAQFAEVLVTDIHPNRKQPRQVFDEDELAELAFSVKELGVLQPVVVRPSREGEGAKYELVMGERRWRAVQKAGLDSVPAIIRETSDDDLLRDALLENLHRSQLNPLEEAAAYQQLLEEFGATQDELSRRIGRSRPQISNTLRLLRLPPLVQRRVAAGVISSGHARALLGLTDPAEMERLAQRIVAEGMSVRATEETVALADGLKRHATKRKAPSQRHDDRLNYIADAFSDRLDTSVRIQLGARKGKMTIEFASVEDLNRIIDVLDPKMEDPS